MPIIVVGAVDYTGRRSTFSQGTIHQISVSAPGTVECPEALGNQVGLQQGTSMGKFLQILSTFFFSDLVYLIITKTAAATVSGLAAYLLSLDQYREVLVSWFTGFLHFYP